MKKLHKKTITTSTQVASQPTLARPAAKVVATITPASAQGALLPLATPRLQLRPLTAADMPTLMVLLNDWQVSRFLATPPYPYTMDAAGAYIAASQMSVGSQDQLVLGITRATDGQLLGGCQIVREQNANGLPVARLAYWLGQAFWGQGYAPEAAAAIIAHAFANWQVAAIHAYVQQGNQPSVQLLERLGFTAAGAVPPPAIAGRQRATPLVDFFVLPTAAWQARPARQADRR